MVEIQAVAQRIMVTTASSPDSMPPPPRDWWLSLTPTCCILPSYSKAVCPLPGTKGRFTLWDQLEVFGQPEWTLQDFLDDVNRKFDMRPNLVVQGLKMVYVEAMPMHRQRLLKP